MLTIRKSEERGHFDFGWLDTRHTFSFGEYYDPAHMGFSLLRVINDDRVAPGGGFPMHPHRDMEIVTYVLDGALAHKDSLGNGSTIQPGDVQRMSAGTGIRHSEFNASQDKPVHLLQIWLMPGKAGIAPGYEQKMFDAESKRNRLRLVASPDGAEGSVTIHTDASIRASILDKDASLTHTPAKGRVAWLHVARGSVSVGGRTLKEGDAIGADEPLAISGVAPESDILLFDLPV
ncbi:MAG: pirin family protein [Hyphomicrobiales bacterium]|nr:pirin family protein [Hyphomicrobiales bacterium]